MSSQENAELSSMNPLSGKELKVSYAEVMLTTIYLRVVLTKWILYFIFTLYAAWQHGTNI